jgi:hypothetical protein
MRSPVALGVPAVILALLFGCSQGSSPTSKSLRPVAWVSASENESLERMNHHADSRAGPHTLKVHTDVPHYTWIQGPRAGSSFDGHELVVEFNTERVLLDNTPAAKLPTGTKEVEIRFAGGKLSITADGADVARAEAIK